MMNDKVIDLATIGQLKFYYYYYYLKMCVSIAQKSSSCNLYS